MTTSEERGISVNVTNDEVNETEQRRRAKGEGGKVKGHKGTGVRWARANTSSVLIYPLPYTKTKNPNFLLKDAVQRRHPDGRTDKTPRRDARLDE